MKELDASAQTIWERAVRRRTARDRLRVRRAALNGRLALYQDLLDPLVTQPLEHLNQWRVGLHLAMANELRQRAGVDVAERFLSDAYAAALADLWTMP